MPNDSPLRILLIEDNPGDARFIRELLGEGTELSARVRDQEPVVERAGASERIAPTVRHETRLASGLERLDEETIDVVLLDLDLPDSDGLETLSTLHDHTDAPVVVLTGLRDRDTGIEALHQGAEEYLVKDEINSDLLVRSVYHAIERREHERELRRYETLIEESTDVNAIIDPDGTLRYITPSVDSVLGYAPDELLGENAFEYIHPDDHEVSMEALDGAVEGVNLVPTEFRFRHADGSWIVLEARSQNLLDDPLVGGIVVYNRDVTERVEHERRLKRQREQLAALNNLNAVVRNLNKALLRQSTREEVEALVCEELADSGSYRFAWVADVDSRSREIRLRTEAGVEGYLDDIDPSVDPDDSMSRGPTARAFLTGEMQVVQDVREDSLYEPWRERAEAYGYRSAAAVPLAYEGTLYGVLNVYADRPRAFEGEERAVIGQLGELVGHVINSIERKQALMSDEVVELELRVQNFLDAFDVSEPETGRITLDRAIPLGDDEYLEYGTATDEAIETLETLVDRVPHFEECTVVDEKFDTARYELRLSEPPALSIAAAHGGRIRSASIEDGCYRMIVEVPPSVDTRQVTDAVLNAYPKTEVTAQRQMTRRERPSHRLHRVFTEELTDRQRSILEVAYFAGFYSSPREASGKEIAESLDIAAPTFHEHLRKAHQKLLGILFTEESASE